jgi:hypothetical protein
MSLLRRRTVFAAKAEATVGTAETLTASEGVFNVYDLLIQPNISMTQREGQGAFNYLAAIAAGRQGTATFSTDIYWGGDSGSLPPWATVLLPACGWVNTSGTFKPKTAKPGTTSSDPRTITIGGFVDGKYRKLSGCMGTFSIDLPTGDLGRINWTFSGKWEAETDSAIIAPTYPTDLPSRCAGDTFQFNNANICVASATIDAGNTVVMRECTTHASGYASAIVTNRQPVITADPEAVLVASLDRYLALTASTEYELEYKLPTAGSGTIVFLAPKAQIQTAAQGNRNDIVTDDITWQCNKNGTTNDEELTIQFVDATP